MGLFAVLATALASCGGGSGSKPDVIDPLPTTPPVTLPAPDYLAVGWTLQGPTGYTLSVFDPAAPNPPKLSVAGTGWPETEQATSFDAATGTMSYMGEPAVYYTKDSKLFRVSLRKTDATVPVQVSLLNNVCWIKNVWQSSLGREPLIEVGVAASPSECSTSFLREHAFTRANATASTPAIRALTDRTVLQQLADPGSPQDQYFVVRDDTNANLWLYDQTMKPVSAIVGGTNAYSYFSGGTSLRTSSALYVSVNSELREISWSATGATLQPGIYKFTGSGGTLPIDAQTHLLIDGLTLKRVSNNQVSATLATLDRAKGDVIKTQSVTPTHVILQQSSSTSTPSTITLYSVAKQDLRVQALGVNVGSNAVIGQAAGAVYYQSSGLIRRINVDGTGDKVVAGSLAFKSLPLLARSFSVYASPPLEGVMWCERVVSESNCANGKLKVVNTSTLSTTLLGQFSHPGFYQWSDPIFGPENTVSPFLTLDTPVVLIPTYVQPTSSSPMGQELYVVRPGTAGSLVQISP
jgi:hypothetical protein